MRELYYNRQKAVEYAVTWALSRNPKFYNFDELGGDCTNFISQCIYTGGGVMNYTPDVGWYYINLNRRAAAWTGAEYLHKFLINNKSVGPYGVVVPISQIMVGDVIQLMDSGGRIYHSLFVTRIMGEASINTIQISTHTYDARNRSLSSYEFYRLVPIHIDGVRGLQIVQYR